MDLEFLMDCHILMKANGSTTKCMDMEFVHIQMAQNILATGKTGKDLDKDYAIIDWIKIMKFAKSKVSGFKGSLRINQWFTSKTVGFTLVNSNLK